MRLDTVSNNLDTLFGKVAGKAIAVVDAMTGTTKSTNLYSHTVLIRFNRIVHLSSMSLNSQFNSHVSLASL